MATETRIREQAVCCPTGDVRGHGVDAAADGSLPGVAEAFKALSDETRLRIVRTIARSPHAMCECHIVPLFGLSQSTISYHLKVLREAGIIESEKRGVWAYYRLNPRALTGAIKSLADLV